MVEIEEYASKHLGRSSDGTAHAKYVTPNFVDESLLVAVPRHLNRTTHNINQYDFVGVDVWNCYEFSFLAVAADLTANDETVPVNYIAKIAYPANSPNIVESKSLKLFLNSFNNYFTTVDAATTIIKNALSKVIGDHVDVYLHNVSFTGVKGYLPGGQNEYTQWKYSHLRSNCRVTNQPDWGDVYVQLIGGIWDFQYEDVNTYIYDLITSFRNENHFHEEVCELLYDKIKKKFNFNHIVVACFYTRRGGIDINPIRASSEAALGMFDSSQYRYASTLSEKTLRQ